MYTLLFIQYYCTYFTLNPFLLIFHSADSPVKDMFTTSMHAVPTHLQGSAVVSVGKTVVSLKLVPSISSVGYIKAVMYHNKSVMLKDPFSSLDEQAYFRNLDTATRWLTE